MGLNTRILWGDPDEKKTRELLRLSKPELSRMMGVVTGHSQLLEHLSRIGVAKEDECRACGEDSETLGLIPYRYYMTHLRGICWRKLRNFVNDMEFL
ncbi:hypothetical protein EVAR_74154_1 [Eumeta japonica]|uniref:Uncharacterized protein n=1 Tax=Eumeta variegata TaxID=151549 RepID=A0A4C1SPB4_EUMVA|nr:hypothetical protein EVAR_74154_1 [Eumeta japonica]